MNPAEPQMSKPITDDRIREIRDMLESGNGAASVEDMIALCDRALGAGTEGMVLVPCEPTEAMLKAAASLKSPIIKYRSIYRAMIGAASPTIADATAPEAE